MSLFVTIEGIEGSGKTTQARRLAAALKSRGLEVVATREPGGTAAGESIRRVLLDPRAAKLDALAELLLYLADRAQHVREVIAPALAEGRIVISDRFSDSTVAYQGYGRGLDIELVTQLDASARQGIEPGLTLLLDCPPELGLARAAGRTPPSYADRFEQEPAAFHARVRDGFLALAAAHRGRVVVLDAAASPDQVLAQALGAVLARLGSPP